MNEDFITFEIAKKLKEKGFNCELPYAMYNEIGQFCLLTTSAPYHVCESGYKYREYYYYNDFDKNDFIAPTISQVLKWLRKEKKVHIGFGYSPRKKWRYVVMYMDDRFYNKPTLAVDGFLNIEQAALVGIEYVIDNLI